MDYILREGKGEEGEDWKCLLWVSGSLGLGFGFGFRV